MTNEASPALITPDLVRLDVALGADKDATIDGLVAVLDAAGRALDADAVRADVLAREAKSSTGLPGGIAIPHCRTAGVAHPTLTFARLAPPVDFGAKDGAADLAFLITAPDGGGSLHMKILQQLARALAKPDFTAALRAATTPEEVVAAVESAVTLPAAEPAPATAPTASEPAAPAAAATTGQNPPRLVAVTACPTGIAHTYMAAEALEAAAARAGVDLQVETQGSAGSTPLSPQVIAAADAVVFAVDVGVRDQSRFAGKPVVRSGVKRPIDDADAMIAEALRAAADPSARRVEGSATEAGESEGDAESWGARTRRVLMTGVSYMIPFTAAGGLLIALGFLFGGYTITGPAGDIVATNSITNLPDLQAAGLENVLFDSPLLAYLGALLFTLGGAAFGFLVPALAGYIAYAIADRPGIAPGFVMGAIAGTINSGFLGGIIGGVLAGVVALWIGRIKVPTWARGLMPVLVIPLGATLVAGLLMLVVLARPLSWLMDSLTDGLNSLDGGSAVLLGAILGLMMAFDMGGPLNKVAYGFATAGLANAAATSDAPELKVMAAVMLAGMVPPLALALATFVRPRLFSPVERENGKAAGFLGISFITEGAIPFAAADPLRVIPSIMLGSAVTGGLSQLFDVGLRAPHGGVFVIFAVVNVAGFFIALVAGTIVATAAVLAAKTFFPVASSGSAGTVATGSTGSSATAPAGVVAARTTA
ncbi:fructose-specific PTS transporter subunit EIIC [Nocardioides zeae]|uniref:Fructose-specific PTS transporter subunit EIIC n=1 Tax=Nocardioides imazamoxiresistens TaxID=3231893 RepID=A0ABU3PXC1_9ACTN|nr:fructose-specific PTS transporter subunit EIIC [Nocardioides zeae]MDT9593839.1 fructose-specific PTS transporter subunit EIIC [Nocardioides zeae]